MPGSEWLLGLCPRVPDPQSPLDSQNWAGPQGCAEAWGGNRRPKPSYGVHPSQPSAMPAASRPWRDPIPLPWAPKPARRLQGHGSSFREERPHSSSPSLEPCASHRPAICWPRLVQSDAFSAAEDRTAPGNCSALGLVRDNAPCAGRVHHHPRKSKELAERNRTSLCDWRGWVRKVGNTSEKANCWNAHIEIQKGKTKIWSHSSSGYASPPTPARAEV